MKKEQSAKFLKLCLADALLKLMESKPYAEININAVCETAGVGRTTYYRYFGNKDGKDELLIFKIVYEIEEYTKLHESEAKEDGNKVFLNCIYEQRKLCTSLHKNGLIYMLMAAFEKIAFKDTPINKSDSYLSAFFVYGYFGVVYQWIKYGFDETPDEVQKHIAETIIAAAVKAKEQG